MKEGGEQGGGPRYKVREEVEGEGLWKEKYAVASQHNHKCLQSVSRAADGRH